MLAKVIVLLSVTLLVSALMGIVEFVLLTDAVARSRARYLPSSIVEKSNQFIISKVGQDFFNKYIKINYSASRYYLPDEYTIKHPEGAAEFLQRPYYLMVYSFKMPEKPFVNGVIEFCVDTDGNLILERAPYGIPDPTKCDFPIDEAAAIQIAKNAGLEEGIAAWETSFHCYGSARYVWTVQNTLTLSTSPEQGGNGVVIDANSGEVIENYGWACQP